MSNSPPRVANSPGSCTAVVAENPASASQRRISSGSYTALVGVCLSEQMQPGSGQFAVLKGLHEEVEAAFRLQRDAGSVIGAEGVGWPRIKIAANGRPYMNGLPDSIRSRAAELAKTNPAIDGWPWPELTPVLMDPGDAVIAMHSLPHTPTPNRLGSGLSSGRQIEAARGPQYRYSSVRLLDCLRRN